MKNNQAKAMVAVVAALAIPALTATAALAQSTAAPNTPRPPSARPIAPDTALTGEQPNVARGLPDTTTDAAGKVTVLGEAATNDSFAQLATSGGIFEVESSRIARDRATNEQVRAFANQMIQDHTQANQQLTSLAQTQGVMVRPSVTGKQQQMLQQLQSAPSSTFDRQYMTDQVAAHEETIRVFETAAGTTDTSMRPFRSFAEQTLPTLRHHLQQAQALSGSGLPTAQK